MSSQNSEFFFVSSLSLINKDDWNNCVGEDHPFTRYEYLHALENSKSVSNQTGWKPHHYIEKNNNNEIIALCPLYIKNHSFGEYIFDHSWAEAYYRNGQNYYPKLQSAIPFTPVTGNRIILNQKIKNKKNKKKSIINNIIKEAVNLNVSSLHFNFVPKPDTDLTLMIRQGIQFHWKNKNYKSFDDFLNSLSARKRKSIKKERRCVVENNLEIKLLTGELIKKEHMDFFYDCYLDTTGKKWGSTYLTKNFFLELLNTFNDKILLIVTYQKNKMVASAINFLSKTHLYGRLWGSKCDIPFLHFEICYYQAIEYAIKNKLKIVEAGAQGEHKLQRGYLPTKTWSLHWIKERRFSDAIKKYLEKESHFIDMEKENMEQINPFK